MIDDGEADDKIVAVLANDPVFDHANDLQDLPVNMVDRLDHYFRTYKAVPGAAGRVEIEARYGMTDACAVVEAAIADYGDKFGSVAS
jgi:inorganic pyrophosphatase